MLTITQFLLKVLLKNKHIYKHKRKCKINNKKKSVHWNNKVYKINNKTINNFIILWQNYRIVIKSDNINKYKN